MLHTAQIITCFFLVILHLWRFGCWMNAYAHWHMMNWWVSPFCEDAWDVVTLHHGWAPDWSVAISTNCFQHPLSWACCHAEFRPWLSGWRSSFRVRRIICVSTKCWGSYDVTGVWLVLWQLGIARRPRVCVSICYSMLLIESCEFCRASGVPRFPRSGGNGGTHRLIGQQMPRLWRWDEPVFIIYVDDVYMFCLWKSQEVRNV